MFLSTILVALIVGALLGGGLPRLGDLHLRWSYLLGLALAVRIVAGLSGDVEQLASLPVGGLYILSYALVLAWLWGNWRVPGLQVAAVGIGANLLAVLINGGKMPIWSGAFYAAGFTDADIAGDPFHFILQVDSVAEFVARGGLFGDVIPLPIPVIRDVISIGDVLLALGIFWAIVYSMTRTNAPARSTLALGGSQLVRPAGAGGAAAIGVGYSESSRVPAELSAAGAEVAGLRRQSPYLRLVRNRNFSLLWVGQLVSLFGERIHTVALGFLVLEATGSALEVGLTFAATAIPNVSPRPARGGAGGPLEPALDDDRLRPAASGAPRAVPFAVEIDIRLVYVMAFLIATVTLLFRPAKTAVIPAVVEQRDLVTANSMSTLPIRPRTSSACRWRACSSASCSTPMPSRWHSPSAASPTSSARSSSWASPSLARS